MLLEGTPSGLSLPFRSHDMCGTHREGGGSRQLILKARDLETGFKGTERNSLGGHSCLLPDSLLLIQLLDRLAVISWK